MFIVATRKIIYLPISDKKGIPCSSYSTDRLVANNLSPCHFHDILAKNIMPSESGYMDSICDNTVHNIGRKSLPMEQGELEPPQMQAFH